MFIKSQIYKNRLKYLLKKFNKFLIIGHKKPDGDAIGSMLALYRGLNKIGKNCTLACEDKLSNRFNFLADSDKIIDLAEAIKNIENYQAIITLDCGDYKLTGLDNHVTRQDLPLLINIDHHQDNPGFGDVNIIEAEKSSTAEMVYDIIGALGIDIDNHIATCILNGIFLDTDSFKNPNTSIRTLKITSILLSRGANLREITKNTLRDKSLSTLKLWGRVLSRIKKHKQLGIVSTVVTQEDFKACQATPEDMDGIANFLNSIPDAKASLVLSERSNNEIKGSFRTLKDEVDVSKIAALFGGGGHKKAAGFTMPGSLHQVNGQWQIN